MNTRRWSAAGVALCAGLWLPLGVAQGGPRDCAALSEGQRAVAEAVFRDARSYACCDQDLATCLRTRADCKVVTRLANYVCRRAAMGTDADDILRDLGVRALTMIRPAKRYPIDTSAAPRVGAADAPVQLVVYVCARCPYCARMLTALHREVTEGRLRGKAALLVRVFPVKGHRGAVEANLGFAAAYRLGKFWAYALHAYRSFNRFDLSAVDDWAEAVGLPRQAFVAERQAPRNRAWLVAAKKEGLRNGVRGTPALYLNGYRYRARLDLDTVVDVVLEEAERAGK